MVVGMGFRARSSWMLIAGHAKPGAMLSRNHPTEWKASMTKQIALLVVGIGLVAVIEAGLIAR